MVLIQPHGNLQLLEFICIPVPGHVNSKDNPVWWGKLSLFAQLGTAVVGLPFLAEDVWL